MPCSERIISVQMTKITVWSLCHHMGRTVRTKEPFLGGPQIPLRWMGIFFGGGIFQPMVSIGNIRHVVNISTLFGRLHQRCGLLLPVLQQLVVVVQPSSLNSWWEAWNTMTSVFSWLQPMSAYNSIVQHHRGSQVAPYITRDWHRSLFVTCFIFLRTQTTTL